MIALENIHGCLWPNVYLGIPRWAPEVSYSQAIWAGPLTNHESQNAHPTIAVCEAHLPHNQVIKSSNSPIHSPFTDPHPLGAANDSDSDYADGDDDDGDDGAHVHVHARVDDHATLPHDPSSYPPESSQ